jgi:hypothetical protein
MRQTFLTRRDTEVGEGVFDSIAWAMEVHVKAPDTGEFNFAVLFGNEDAPVRIEFYTQTEPKVMDVPVRVWVG